MADNGTSALPQANKLDTLRGVVRLVAEKRATPAVALDRLRLSDRHWSYYRRAAISVGLVAEVEGGFRVTDLGKRMLVTAAGSREEALVWLAAIRATPALATFVPFFEGRDTPTEAGIVAQLETSLGPTTAVRRMETMRSWRKQLVRQLGRTVGAPGPVPEQLVLRPAPRWPDATRFPHNDGVDRRVRDIVDPDLVASESVLIITGYGSLDVLLDTLGRESPAPPERVRIAFGVEPHAEVAPKQLRGGSVADEVRDYWLERGISVALCTNVLRVLALLDAGRLEVRLSPSHEHRLHAKIFATDRAVTLGSSNFSRGGLDRLLEANARFERKDDAERYEEATLLAEALWDSAEPFDGFRALLDALLRPVGWMEALARACAELLEGEWAEHAGWKGLGGGALWPSQRSGIARALWVLEEVGSVLVADATGSGKTRMAAHLLRALRNRLFSRGEIGGVDRVDPVVASPPGVMDNWRDELVEQGLLHEPVSHGRLSQPNSPGFARVKSAIARTQILAIDEGHRFLNRASNRTAALVASLADHVLVFTATPISRSARDLLGIVDLLGADNLEPEVIEILGGLWGRHARPRDLSQEQLEGLRRELRRFTVRRTRQALNRLVDREPERYVNALGNRCRYPEPHPHVYSLNESENDRALASTVYAAASRLRGVLSLGKPIELTDELRRAGWTEELYVQARLRGAAALAKHHVLAALRSSRAALWEHLHGTKDACERYGVRERVKSSDTGNLIGELVELARVSSLPAQPHARVLPAWLTDLAEHHVMVDAERGVYEEIARAVTEMSDHREDAKAERLASLASAQRPTIAFDSRPITLAVIRDNLRRRAPGRRVLLAVGGTAGPRRQVEDAFGLRARTNSCPIALCSDAMSEGLNLQGGSAVVHLDMPSTVRQAEQRVGRIVRMDSPHTRIDVYWPMDAEEFALRTDDRFVQRVDLVESLIGSNLDLPSEFRDPKPVRPEDLIHEVQESERELELDDAFAPVAALVEGPKALVDPETYERIRTSRVRVVSCVSVVRSRTAWIFVAVRAAGSGAPRWALVRDAAGEPERDLGLIADALRELLGSEATDLPFDEDAGTRLVAALRVLGQHEHLLLPPKKRRALKQMSEVLRRYRHAAENEPPRRRLVDQLLRWLEPPDGEREVDLRDLSDGWLRAIHPRWRERLHAREGRARPILLAQLTRSLVQKPLSSDELCTAFASVRGDRPLTERVVAAIVGRPSGL